MSTFLLLSLEHSSATTQNLESHQSSGLQSCLYLRACERFPKRIWPCKGRASVTNADSTSVASVILPHSLAVNDPETSLIVCKKCLTINLIVETHQLHQVCQFVVAAITKYHNLGGLKQGYVFGSQGAGRATLPPKPLGEDFSLPLPTSGNPMLSLACGSITPPFFTCVLPSHDILLPLCISAFKFSSS